jgi:hypothetical protein
MTSTDRAFYDAYYQYESADDYPYDSEDSDAEFSDEFDFDTYEEFLRSSDDYPELTAEQVQDLYAALAARINDLVIDVDPDTVEALNFGVATRGAHPYDYPDEYWPDTYEERQRFISTLLSSYSDEDDTELEQQTTVEKPTSPAAKTAKDGEEACFVCFTNVPDAMFPQCGHSGLCCVCADKIVKSTQNKCPLCRGPATSFVMVEQEKSEPLRSVKVKSADRAFYDAYYQYEDVDDYEYEDADDYEYEDVDDYDSETSEAQLLQDRAYLQVSEMWALCFVWRMY